MEVNGLQGNDKIRWWVEKGFDKLFWGESSYYEERNVWMVEDDKSARFSLVVEGGGLGRVKGRTMYQEG